MTYELAEGPIGLSVVLVRATAVDSVARQKTRGSFYAGIRLMTCRMCVSCCTVFSIQRSRLNSGKGMKTLTNIGWSFVLTSLPRLKLYLVSGARSANSAKLPAMVASWMIGAVLSVTASLLSSLGVIVQKKAPALCLSWHSLFLTAHSLPSVLQYRGRGFGHVCVVHRSLYDGRR